MESLGTRVHSFIDQVDAARLLAKYYGGRYTGSKFDTAHQLQSPNPNQFTAHDFAAVAVLAVPLSHRAVAGLIDKEAELADLLEQIPADLDLAEAKDTDLAPVFAIQDSIDQIADIGHVRRSKLLARKRPRLVPVRDEHILNSLVGRDSGPLTLPLRDALAEDTSITDRLRSLQAEAQLPVPISPLRTLDVIVWMAAHGDAQVAD